MKICRIAITAALFAAVPATAHADPISLSVGLLAGALSAAVGAGTWIAIGIGALTAELSYVRKMLFDKPKTGVGNRSYGLGDITPQSFPVGDYGIEGDPVWFNTFGKDGDTPNAFLVQVFAVSDLPTSMTGLIVEGKTCTLGSGMTNPHPDWGTPIPEFVGVSGKIFLWYKYYDGTQTEADSWLVSQFPSSNLNQLYPYDSSRIGTGRAYIILTARANDKVFQGFPKPTVVTPGIPLYDITKDGDAGGSGAHRWNDPSTWEPSNNTQVQRYNIRRGIYYGVPGTGQWMFGGQNLGAFRLPYDNWSANIGICATVVDNVGDTYRGTCTVATSGSGASKVATIALVDEQDQTDPYGFALLYAGARIQINSYAGIVASNTGTVITTEEGWTGPAYATATAWTGFTGGGSEPQFRSGGIVRCDEEPATVDESLLRACNGRSIVVGGVIKTTTGAAPETSDFSLTDADVIITSERQNDQYAGHDGLINGITGSHPDPDTWNIVDAPPIYDAEFLAEDNGERLTSSVEYEAVPWPQQVQRNMRSALNEGRNWRRHNVVLPPPFWRIEPGDTGPWTSSINQYAAKRFRVESAKPLADRCTQVLLRELDSTDYDYTPISDFQATPVGSIEPVESGDIPAPDAATLSASAIVTTGPDGAKVSGIQAGADEPSDPNVVAILIRYKLHSGSTWFDGPHIKPVAPTGYTVISGLVPSGVYDVGFAYRLPQGDSGWTVLESITAGADLVATGAVDGSITEAALDPDYVAAVAAADAAEAAARAAADTAEQGAREQLAAAKELSDSVIRQLTADLASFSNSLMTLQTLHQLARQQNSSTLAFAKDELTTQIVEGLSAQAEKTLELEAYVEALVGVSVDLALAAQVYENQTAIADLTTGKASATDFTLLDAQVNTPTTGLAAVVASNAEAISALDPESAVATLQTTLVAVRQQGATLDVFGNSLASVLVALADTTKRTNAALAYHRSEITTQVTEGQSALASAVGELGVILQTETTTRSAAITTEQSARANADSAETSARIAAISTLTDGLVSTNAAITAEASTRASADSAETSARESAISDLSSDLDDALAAIISEANTRATADTAEANTRASQIATVTAAAAAAQGTANTNTAAITSEATTRANADTAIAGNVTALTTTVGGHTTTLVEYGNSIDGLSAQWGVAINVDGHVTGLVRLDSGDTESNFVVIADNFLVYDGVSSTVPLLALSGGVAYLNVPLQASTVTTSNLIDNSITSLQLSANYVGGTVTVSSGTPAEICRSDSYSAHGTGIVKVVFHSPYSWDATSSSGGLVYMRCTRHTASDGTLETTLSTGPTLNYDLPTVHSTSGAIIYGFVNVPFFDIAPQGDHAVYYKVSAIGDAGVFASESGQFILSLEEFKK